MKVFIGPCEVAGYFARLELSFQKIGIEAKFIDFENDNNFYSRSVQKHDKYLSMYFKFCKRLIKHTGFDRMFWRVSKMIIYRILVLMIILKYDSFIFSSGRSFFSGWELPLLRMLNKKIIFVYLGSDSRPPYLNGVYYAHKKWQSWSYLAKETRRIYKKVRWQEIWASYIIDHPPSGATFRKRLFIPYLRMGYPFDCETLHKKSKVIRKSVYVLHAPSLPEVKGSTKIRQLLGKYENIKYVELINRPNIEVLEEISKCDFIFDELYSDTTLGALGAEAASYAKPTLVSGYIPFGAMCPGADYLVPPAVYVAPSKIIPMLERLTCDRLFREEIGENAQRYINKNWKPEIVALRYATLLKKKAPIDWFFDPNKQLECYSYGMAEDVLVTRLLKYINIFGEGALCLDHSKTKRNHIMHIISMGLESVV